MGVGHVKLARFSQGNLSCLRLDCISLFSRRCLSKVGVFQHVSLLGSLRSRAAWVWSKATCLCLAAAWALRSGRAAAKVRWVPGSEKAGLFSESHL